MRMGTKDWVEEWWKDILRNKVTNYITVNSTEEYTQKIEQAGGKIIVPITEIPNMGYYEIFLDNEGNMFGLYQANK